MSLASELRKVADRLEVPGFREARRRRVPLDHFRLFERVKNLTDLRTVLDVGANKGAFSRWAAQCFPKADIHAFEPLTPCQTPLGKVAAEFAKVKIHQLALGDSIGTVEMFQNDYTPSSSLLPMEERHKELWPKTAGAKKISVPLETLDNVTARLGVRGPAFLKLDVQGFELHVLRGATRTLNDVAVVMSEVLFENLYAGQADFGTLVAFLGGRGFRFLEFAEERRLPPLGRLVYADAVFVKAGLKFK